MPRYLTTARITQAAAQALLKDPQDREAVLRPVVAAAGATLEHFWVSLDTMEVIEVWVVDDPAGMDALALAAAAGGAVDNSTGQVRRILTGPEVAETARRAGATGYRPPGG